MRALASTVGPTQLTSARACRAICSEISSGRTPASTTWTVTSLLSASACATRFRVCDLPERVSPAVAGPAPNGSGRSVRVPRRTSLQLQRLEPWSVLKLSLVLSVAGFLVWMIAVGVLYGVLAGMGVWDQINGTYSDLTSANNSQMSTELVSGGRVFGVAMVIGLVNIVLMTALATVGSLIYNVAADLVGGIEVTLSEPD